MPAEKMRAGELKTLRRMAESGKPVSEIAYRLKRSQSIVCYYFRKWGIKIPSAPSTDHITQEDVEKAVYDYQNRGISYSDSASALGIYEIQMRNLVKRYMDDKFLKRLVIPSGNGKSELGDDPRSEVCKQIEICQHHQCHLHRKCPAYHNYLMRRKK